jgi:hypothetical protein
MGRKRELISSPADTAEARPPPAARMLTDANCAAPANTTNDMTTAAAAPISGSASTPNDVPIASVGSTNGSPARMPSAIVLHGETGKGLMAVL